MQIFPREQQAIDTYFSLLVKKGATFYQVSERLEVLIELTYALRKQSQSLEAFTQAVEQVVSKKEAQQQHYFRKVAQEYFIFWMGDAINITLFEQHYHFDFESSEEATQTSAGEIFSNLQSKNQLLKAQKAKGDKLDRHLLSNDNMSVH